MVCFFVSTFVWADHPLPVYKPQRNNISVLRQEKIHFAADTDVHASAFTVADYTQRKPFEETDVSILSSQTRPMRAPTEDDPEFPGDPGEMPVGDGISFLLSLSLLYAFIRKSNFLFKHNNTEV